MPSPTTVHQAVAQIIEWTYGRTNIEFEITGVFFHVGDGIDYAFRVVTNTARLDKIKHPLGLVVESLHLSITGSCDSLVDLNHKSKEFIEIDLEDLTEFNLHQDQGGYSTVSVQNLLGLCDGGEKSISRHFVFRSNLLHALR